jgi:hypothetical protein
MFADFWRANYPCSMIQEKPSFCSILAFLMTLEEDLLALGLIPPVKNVDVKKSSFKFTPETMERIDKLTPYIGNMVKR